MPKKLTIYDIRKEVAINVVATVKNQFVSVPPSGKNKVVNLYVDPDTGKLVIEYDNTPFNG